jgi:hypothetical protein
LCEGEFLDYIQCHSVWRSIEVVITNWCSQRGQTEVISRDWVHNSLSLRNAGSAMHFWTVHTGGSRLHCWFSETKVMEFPSRAATWRRQCRTANEESPYVGFSCQSFNWTETAYWVSWRRARWHTSRFWTVCCESNSFEKVVWTMPAEQKGMSN